MKRPTRIVRLSVCAALLVVAAAGVYILRSDSPSVVAAPHVVQAKNHPFDPDWPEVYLILTTKCLRCHAPGTDHSDLSSYQALMAAKTEDDEPVVVPGRPADSPLLANVTWNVRAWRDSDLPDEPLMPDKQHEWLTAGQLETVRRWIARGAFQYKLPATCKTPRRLLEIDFPSAAQCKTCHPVQYDQWSRSMHHYAQHSPVFEAFNLTLIERTSGTIGTFCSRCHTPLGTALGENGSRRNVHRSRLSMEGVTCVVCHGVGGGEQ